jgi:zinc/manganese transport system permease protein
MSEFITFMGAPIAACIVLTLVYTYFGCHVLKREIIFIDLSLAQLAALGTTVAFVLHLELDSPGSIAISLLFILAGSIFFSFTRNLNANIPQEAIIGIVYVVSASVALLLANQMPHGAEHLKNLLNGSVLWVNWGDVLHIFCVTLLVGVVHWMTWEKIFKQSQVYKNSFDDSSHSWTSDFLFYITLGLVIVISVRTAGVFLIFTFLIVPAVCGALFSQSMIKQFIIGSILGLLSCITGLSLSFYLDQPTGATLVCTFGIAFFASIFWNRLKTTR